MHLATFSHFQANLNNFQHNLLWDWWVSLRRELPHLAERGRIVLFRGTHHPQRNIFTTWCSLPGIPVSGFGAEPGQASAPVYFTRQLHTPISAGLTVGWKQHCGKLQSWASLETLPGHHFNFQLGDVETATDFFPLVPSGGRPRSTHVLYRSLQVALESLSSTMMKTHCAVAEKSGLVQMCKTHV